MDLQNVKVCFLGDSITEGVGASDQAHRYTDVFARKSGAIIQVNGISGTRIAKQKTPSEKPSYDLYFGSRVDELDADAQVVVVFGGTNDFGHGDAPFGSYADEGEDTFCGAMKSLLEKLINRFPKSIIVIMTPIHRLSENEPVNEIGLERPLFREYIQAEKDLAASYSVPVLDLWSISGIQPRLDIQREMYAPDGLHPSDAGAEKIADLLIAYLKATF